MESPGSNHRNPDPRKKQNFVLFSVSNCIFLYNFRVNFSHQEPHEKHEFFAVLKKSF